MAELRPLRLRADPARRRRPRRPQPVPLPGRGRRDRGDHGRAGRDHAGRGLDGAAARCRRSRRSSSGCWPWASGRRCMPCGGSRRSATRRPGTCTGPSSRSGPWWRCSPSSTSACSCSRWPTGCKAGLVPSSGRGLGSPALIFLTKPWAHLHWQAAARRSPSCHRAHPESVPSHGTPLVATTSPGRHGRSVPPKSFTPAPRPS